MNLRHRWWMAGALLCVSAAAMQRARGEELPPVVTVPAASQPASGVTSAPVDAGLLPLRQEAEAAYRARNFGEAQSAFERLVTLDPGDAQAWLRLGNLHQMAGRDEQALQAYRSASRIAALDEATAHARGKALINIALLSVRAASRAIDAFDAMRLTALTPARDAAARQVGAARRRATRAETRLDARIGSSTGTEAPRVEAELQPSPSAPADFQPYTVDRWIATPRRPGPKRAAGRSSVREPLTDTPLPPSPVVDVIRALPDSPSSPTRAGKR